MASIVSFNSTDSDVLFIKQVSSETNPLCNDTSNVLISTELSETHTREMLTLSSVTYPEPYIINTEADSKESTIPYGFGIQQPIVPPSLNDLNLPPNPFKLIATTVVIPADLIQHEEDYSPPITEAVRPVAYFSTTCESQYY